MKNIDKISNRTTILFLSWRDIKAPKMGGAEIYTHEILKRVNHKKYRILHFSPLVENLSEEEIIDNVLYIRSGGVLSVINHARLFYKSNRFAIDYVVDQCNTHRFFSPFWVESRKRIFFIHQLTREIWYREARFPVNVIGSLTETPFLRLSRKDYTIVVSPSTRQDLLDVGFNPRKICIVPEGLDFKPWDYSKLPNKDDPPVFIYVGRYAKYKGIDDAIEAFCILKKIIPKAKLWIVGKRRDDYIKEVLHPLCLKYGITDSSENRDADLFYWGFVSEEKKLELMSRARALLFPSIREGWGLIVTEAAAVGTPGIVADAPGARDAVDKGNAGYLCPVHNIEALAAAMKDTVEKKEEYAQMRKNAYNFSLGFDWTKSAKVFESFMETVISKGDLS